MSLCPKLIMPCEYGMCRRVAPPLFAGGATADDSCIPAGRYRPAVRGLPSVKPCALGV
eukprot:CAMPEP_0185848998 /NCGR_PEP_ID=MMETSP1354-20130828/3675_1 /TAXON_ID=708628 /ORGANISM="Erythrolobus madagascarensis, Strain CCMP3276" /LENGTH=57 /DNA_ID=CAMNT_0028549471 /DNA_START=42 /DNA_END=211 /DNA_ORIENTATION=-